METYKSLEHLSKSFKITSCYKERFIKRQNGYVIEASINNQLVNVVITPLDKNNKPVIFGGSLAKKTCQALQDIKKIKYKIIEK